MNACTSRVVATALAAVVGTVCGAVLGVVVALVAQESLRRGGRW